MHKYDLFKVLSSLGSQLAVITPMDYETVISTETCFRSDPSEAISSTILTDINDHTHLQLNPARPTIHQISDGIYETCGELESPTTIRENHQVVININIM